MEYTLGYCGSAIEREDVEAEMVDAYVDACAIAEGFGKN